MSDFTSLKDLRIAFPDLSRANSPRFIHKLPSQLETLLVWPGQPEQFIDELIKLAKVAKKDFPQLKEITTEQFDEDNEELEDQVYGAFQETDVKFGTT